MTGKAQPSVLHGVFSLFLAFAVLAASLSSVRALANPVDPVGMASQSTAPCHQGAGHGTNHFTQVTQSDVAPCQHCTENGCQGCSLSNNCGTSAHFQFVLPKPIIIPYSHFKVLASESLTLGEGIIPSSLLRPPI